MCLPSLTTNSPLAPFVLSVTSMTAGAPEALELWQGKRGEREEKGGGNKGNACGARSLPPPTSPKRGLRRRDLAGFGELTEAPPEEAPFRPI